ncbi:MAG: RHS repeat domain-containing protein [Planctomycetota bacterium]|jgi:RHS repeat-associated protein
MKISISGSAYTSADVDYTYDDAYQLTGEIRTGGNSYSQYLYYDNSGNRTKKTLNQTDTVYVYNAADQLTSETTGGTTTTYEYDPNGALTRSDDGTTVKAYSYDYDGYLTAFDTTGTDNDATYTYDADKRRVAKTVDSDTTKYFLAGANVIADYDGSDTLVATYVTPALDDNVSLTTGGSTYYYMKDGLGSIRNLIDANEATQNTYDYYAFGKELGSWSETVTNRYTYTAREHDPESEQYYYRARYYDGNGHFIRRDPARSDIGLYVYVDSMPIGRIDPWGLAWVEAEKARHRKPHELTAFPTDWAAWGSEGDYWQDFPEDVSGKIKRLEQLAWLSGPDAEKAVSYFLGGGGSNMNPFLETTFNYLKMLSEEAETRDAYIEQAKQAMRAAETIYSSKPQSKLKLPASFKMINNVEAYAGQVHTRNWKSAVGRFSLSAVATVRAFYMGDAARCIRTYDVDLDIRAQDWWNARQGGNYANELVHKIYRWKAGSWYFHSGQVAVQLHWQDWPGSKEKAIDGLREFLQIQH